MLSRTDIGSIRPSLLRSSGISAMSWPAALACCGLVIRTGRPSIATRAADAAQHAEQRQQQLALALAVEPAEADDLALADAERDVVQLLAPAEPLDLEHLRRCGRRAPAWPGRRAVYSRPIISSTISSSLLVPLAKVSMCRPLRNTEQRSASALISCMRCEM